MALFLFDWADRASLIVDDENEMQARAVAIGVAGVAPAKARKLPPRLLVCELLAEDGPAPDAPDVIVLRALPHVLEVLGELLEDEDMATAPTVPASVLRIVPPQPALCESEADAPGGVVVRCELPRGHGKHHAGGNLEWVTK